MGKISRYLIVAVIVGTGVVGLWVYQKYFRGGESDRVSVVVERGDLEEIIRVQGEVAPSTKYNLEFPYAGMVRTVFVKEGSEVAAGAALMRLDSSELVLEKERLDSLVAQRTADLSKLIAGATTADIDVYETRVSNAAMELKEAEKAQQLALRAVYTSMDDAVRGTTDAFYSNPVSQTPQLSFSMADSQLEITLEAERVALGAILTRDASLAIAASSTDMHSSTMQLQSDAQRVGEFLDNSARALNIAIVGSTQAGAIPAWQSAVAGVRASLNANVSALAMAEAARTRADAALSVAQKELALRRSSARPEDISMAQAAISEAKSQVKIVQDKIAKMTLVAPVRSKVAHVAYKSGEAYRPGVPAVILDALEPEVQSDVSELDIARVREGASAKISFDALPGTPYSGRVVAIDPQMIEKDGDTYFRVNFSLTGERTSIRAGMTAEVLISVSAKHDVLKVPEYATYEVDGLPYVHVEREGVVVDVPVTLGISDGLYREVTNGLREGEVVVIPTD